MRPKPTPVAKPSHADAAATSANTGNIVSLLSYYKLYNYSFNTKFSFLFIGNLTFYNTTNNFHSQYKPITEKLFIKITKAKPKSMDAPTLSHKQFPERLLYDTI